MNLDEPDGYRRVDRADALADVEAAPEQWSAARSLGPGRLNLDGVTAVVVTGMGGSGITGDVAAHVAMSRLAVPVLVHKGYGMPAFVGRRSLVIAVSYSGDTEETHSAFEAAQARGARVLAVTGGGAIAAACERDGIDHVRVPGGGQPRHALGWLVVPVLAALGLDAGVDEAIAVQREVVASCGRKVDTADNLAKRLGVQLAAGGPIAAYGGQGLGHLAAYRLKCQLNENAELPATHGEVPELNHNEIVGWQDEEAGGGVVWLRDPAGEHPRVARRIALTEDILTGRAAWSAEVTARGHGPLARLASLLLFGDLASVYAAIARDVDPTPIANISRLKRELGQ
jgi:glucose/mannose-6-phosphate isomerase